MTLWVFYASGIKKFIGCNHVRAHEYFSETILRSNSPCGSWAVECENYDKFRNGSCFACSPPVRIAFSRTFFCSWGKEPLEEAPF